MTIDTIAIPTSAEVARYAASLGGYEGPRDVAGKKALAAEYARSPLVGDDTLYVGKPENIFVTIGHAQRLNVHELTALQNLFYGNNGDMAMKGILASGLVRRAGHDIITVHSDARAAVVRIVRGDGQTGVERIWTMEDTDRLGLSDVDHWREYPTNCCYWRALMWAAREACADVLCGIGYTPLELKDRAILAVDDDDDPAEGVEVSAQVAAFLEGIEGWDERQIRAKQKEANREGFLDEPAVLRGRQVLTVRTVLLQAATRLESAGAPAAAPAPAPARLPAVVCICDPATLLSSGQHREDCPEWVSTMRRIVASAKAMPVVVAAEAELAAETAPSTEDADSESPETPVSLQACGCPDGAPHLPACEWSAYEAWLR